MSLVNATSIYEPNFPLLIKTIENYLRSWHAGTFSWFGQAAIIKMTILPRLLYLMRTTPIKLPQNLFKSLHSILLKCLWKHKRPRIKFAFLLRSKEHGGIGLPYFKNDYLVSHLMRINDWHCHTDTKVWVSLESVLNPCNVLLGSHETATHLP